MPYTTYFITDALDHPISKSSSQPHDVAASRIRHLDPHHARIVWRLEVANIARILKVFKQLRAVHVTLH